MKTSIPIPTRPNILLPWKKDRQPFLELFVVTIQRGDVKGLITAARIYQAAAEELGLRSITLMLAHPTDANRRQLAEVFKNWQGICLCRLMKEFTQQQWLADQAAHEERCFEAASRVAPDV